MALSEGSLEWASVPAGANRLARGVAAACALAAVALAVGQLVPQLAPPRDEPLGEVAFVAAFVVNALVGLVIVWHRPGNAVGWLLLATGLGIVLAGALTAYAYRALVVESGALPGGVWARWVQSWVYLAASWAGWTLPLFLLPDGHLPSRRWRPVFAGTVLVSAVSTLSQALRPGPIGDVVPVENPVGVSTMAPLLRVVDVATTAVLLAAIGAGVASLVGRWRSSSRPVQWQLAHVLTAVLLAVTLLVSGVVLSSLGVPEQPLTVVAAVAFALPAIGIGLAVVRGRMLDIEVVVSRTVMWSSISTASLLTYAVVLAVTSRWFAGETGTAVSLLATVVVALGLGAVRQRVEPLLRHRLFGLRDRRYQVLTGLGSALSDRSAPPPAEAVASWVRDSLGLSYAAVEGPEDVCERAAPPGAERFALVYGGRVLGALVVAPPVGEGRLTRDERVVLEDASRQAAMAMQSQKLAREVQSSRARLVRAHEQERRRIRRDVHDGIGPTLAAVPLQLDALVARLDPADADGRALADRVKHGVRDVVGDLRLLIEGLRPRSLDQLGLAGAIHERVAAVEDAGLEVTCSIDIEGGLGPLAEVVVLQVVAESLANVVRHADARRVDVEVRSQGRWVQVDVADDGRGLGPVDVPADMPDAGAGTGVGLDSMRSRTAELGGDLRLGRARLGGLHVRARIPRDSR
jgi:signal transduction histidine kinase